MISRVTTTPLALALTLGLSACATAAGPAAEPAPTTRPVTDEEVRAFTKRVDPGPLPPLLSRAPEAAQVALGVSDPAATPAALEAELAQFRAAKALAAELETTLILRAARVIHIAETILVEAPDSAPALEALVEVYETLPPVSLQFLRPMAEAMIRGSAPPEDAEPLARFVREALESTPHRAQHARAALARRTTSPDRRVAVLRAIAQHEAAAGRLGEARAAARLAARHHPPGRLEDLALLAEVEQASLRLEVAADLIERAEHAPAEDGPEAPTTRARLKEDQAAARTVLDEETPKVAAFEALYGVIDRAPPALGHALADVLAARYPEDARPEVGRILLAFQQGMLMESGLARLEALRGRPGLDRRYYEVKLGWWWWPTLQRLGAAVGAAPEAVSKILAEDAPRLQEDLDAYAAFEPVRAELLRLITGAAERLGRASLAKEAEPLDSAGRWLFPKVRALSRAHPGAADVHAVRLALAPVVVDPSAPEAMLTEVLTPLPDAVAGDPALRRLRFFAGLALIERTGSLDRVADLAQGLAEDDHEPRALVATLGALRDGTPAGWRAAARAWTSAAEATSGETAARHLANAAVATARAEGVEAGAKALLQLLERAPEPALPILVNLARLLPGADMLESLRAVEVDEGDPGELPLVLLLAERGDGAARARLEALVEAAEGRSPQLSCLRGDNEFHAGVGWSAEAGGLVIEADLTLTRWLYAAPCPGLDAARALLSRPDGG